MRIISRWGRTTAAACAANAIRRPHDLALVDDLGQLSFEDLHERSNALAHALSGLGIQERDRIGILCANSRAFVEASFAASKLGCDVVLFNTDFSAPQLRGPLLAQSVKALIYDERHDGSVDQASNGLNLIRVVTYPADGASSPFEHTLPGLIADGDRGDLVPPEHSGKTVILTAGTTGAPKGASRPKPETIEPAIGLLKVVPKKARSICYIAPPLYHLLGNSMFELGCAFGSTLILTERFDPENTLRLIERHGVTELIVVPLMLKRILELPSATRSRYDTDSLELVLSSGSALNYKLAKDFIDELGSILYNLYGATELSWATIATPEDLLDAPGTIGKPPEGTRLEVLGDDDRPLGANQVGRLFVSHDMLFEGYTDKAAKRPVVDGMMSVGDLGHFDENGYFYVDSREDDMIVSGGENVYPGEVEELLLNHPEVEEAAVIGVEDEAWGQSLKAFIVRRAGSQLDERAVREYVKANLARYKVPHRVEFRQALPHNALGKVLKKELVGRRPTDPSPPG